MIYIMGIYIIMGYIMGYIWDIIMGYIIMGICIMGFI